MQTKEKLASFSYLAVKSLLYELNLTPKPGLVDCHNNGAHNDMDFYTFLDSILSLSPFFKKYIEVGWLYHNESPQYLFNQLRKLGIEAEAAMFSATERVNTHKGINFSFALLLGATGSYLAKHIELIQEKRRFMPQDSLTICHLAGEMSMHLIQNDLSHVETKRNLTYGEKLFLQYGLKGLRGEASQGYPSLTQKALPFFRNELLKKQDIQISQLKLLLYLMTFIEDSNIIHRGGIKSWKKVQQEAQTLLEKDLPPYQLKEQLNSYNQILTDRHLSPGGAADLLSLTLYFAFLEQLI